MSITAVDFKPCTAGEDSCRVVQGRSPAAAALGVRLLEPRGVLGVVRHPQARRLLRVPVIRQLVQAVHLRQGPQCKSLIRHEAEGLQCASLPGMLPALPCQYSGV